MSTSKNLDFEAGREYAQLCREMDDCHEKLIGSCAKLLAAKEDTILSVSLYSDPFYRAYDVALEIAKKYGVESELGKILDNFNASTKLLSGESK